MLNDRILIEGERKGIVFVLSAPAGTGKTTLVQKLLHDFETVAMSVSSTTRPKRKGEINDVHYHFLTDEEFEDKSKRGQFLEQVELFGYRYGTDKEVIERLRAAGKHVFLVIDTEGAEKLMRDYPAVFIFVKPPSIDELRSRLSKRGTETEGSLEMRLSKAEEEMRQAKKYDYIIVNDDLDIAYAVLKSILIAETHKVIKKE